MPVPALAWTVAEMARTASPVGRIMLVVGAGSEASLDQDDPKTSLARNAWDGEGRRMDERDTACLYSVEEALYTA
jgi:hypothetical protein